MGITSRSNVTGGSCALSIAWMVALICWPSTETVMTAELTEGAGGKLSL
jgi:hypothetical protein